LMRIRMSICMARILAWITGRCPSWRALPADPVAPARAAGSVV